MQTQKRRYEKKNLITKSSIFTFFSHIKIYDLLDPTSPPCYIREDIKKGVYIEGPSEEVIATPEDAFAVRNFILRLFLIYLIEFSARERQIFLYNLMLPFPLKPLFFYTLLKKMLERGAKNRSTGSTEMNRESSRSHSM